MTEEEKKKLCELVQCTVAKERYLPGLCPGLSWQACLWEHGADVSVAHQTVKLLKAYLWLCEPLLRGADGAVRRFRMRVNCFIEPTMHSAWEIVRMIFHSLLQFSSGATRARWSAPC